MKNYLKSLFISIVLLLFSCADETQDNYVKISGNALGTTFHITYKVQAEPVADASIDSLFHVVNKSLSTYWSDSDISKINAGDTSVIVDGFFEEVFQKSKKVHKETGGFFDPTVGVLVNAWGFGPGKELKHISKKDIDSLLELVGFEKVNLVNGKVRFKKPGMYLDFNANAKGYAVDVIGRFLESEKISDYMVEIGGEIRARGKNPHGKLWKIAIEDPNFDGSRSYNRYITLDNESIATSGNYRKYKIDPVTGIKYAHTIDPKTGYPAKSDLLSASVIAKSDCADADAYATALMAMGYERSKKFLKKHPELKSFLIFVDKDGKTQTFHTENLTLLQN